MRMPILWTRTSAGHTKACCISPRHRSRSWVCVRSDSTFDWTSRCKWEIEMAYYSTMVKVVTVLCVVFLAAHVESARLLKQYDDAGVTAETFPSQEVPEAEAFAELHAEGPVAPYNYNLPADNTPITEDASADEEVYATEGIVVGETTADPSPAQESYVFNAQQEDAPVLTTEDTTTQEFEVLPDSLEGVEPVSDSTSLSADSQQFEFQEIPDEEVSQGGGPGFFAFDDSLASP